MFDSLLLLDGRLLLFIQDFLRHPVLTPIMKGITTLGNNGLIWIVFTVLLLMIPKTRRVGCMLTAALLGTLLINNIILKNLVARTRPYEVIEGLTYLVKKPTDLSFPSGHAGCAFAAACIMFRRLPKRFGVSALVLAALISFSRLYVGVHYPTDVLFGVLSGIAISYAAEAVVGRMWKEPGKDGSDEDRPDKDRLDQDRPGSAGLDETAPGRELGK